MTPRRKLGLTLVVVVAVLLAGVGPAAAVGADGADSTPAITSCADDDRGPGDDGGPPGFVASLTPDFLSDLIGSLPVPGFLKSLFGAC